MKVTFGPIETEQASFPISRMCPVPGLSQSGFFVGSVSGTFLEPASARRWPERMTEPSPFPYFKTSPEVIRLSVMTYVRFCLSLCNIADLLHERGIPSEGRIAAVLTPVLPHLML